MTSKHSFTPKRPDGRPLWKVIYDYVVKLVDSGELGLDGVIPHKNIRMLLNQDESEQYYNAIGKANIEMRRTHKRSLRNKRDFGYVLIGGSAQVTQGDSYRVKAKRSLKRAAEIVKTSDLALMSTVEVAMTDKMQLALGLLIRFARMTADRLNEHEDQLEKLRSNEIKNEAKHRATERELQVIRDRIAKLNEKRGKQ